MDVVAIKLSTRSVSSSQLLSKIERVLSSAPRNKVVLSQGSADLGSKYSKKLHIPHETPT